MDAAYDAPAIRQHSASLGHVPIIDRNPRTKEGKKQIQAEQKRQCHAGYKQAESIRYHERSTVEQVNGRLKDDFGANRLRVKGHAKGMTHLMFGIIALTVAQLRRGLKTDRINALQTGGEGILWAKLGPPNKNQR